MPRIREAAETRGQLRLRHHARFCSLPGLFFVRFMRASHYSRLRKTLAPRIPT